MELQTVGQIALGTALAAVIATLFIPRRKQGEPKQVHMHPPTMEERDWLSHVEMGGEGFTGITAPDSSHSRARALQGRQD